MRPDPSGGPADRVGVLVVRVWVESGSGPEALRARLTSRLDVDEENEETIGAVSIDEILGLTRAWLERFRNV
jgi:hypothetical protein